MVEHAPDPSIGWYGNWGMAASAPEKDFVHLVAAAESAQFKTVGIVPWEVGYPNFDYSKLSSNFGWADTVVIKVGENISPNEPGDLELAMEKLIDAVGEGHPVYVVSTYWTNLEVDKAMYNATEIKGAYWVQVPLHDSTFNAGGFLSRHPGDKGMAMIAEQIVAAMN